MELILNRAVETSIEEQLLELIEDWEEEIFRLDFNDEDGWTDSNRSIAESQYGYIKFGLILEKIRNTCAYKYCADKLKTFKDFCQKKLKLTVWQANSYIEAADTAIYLSRSGFDILPRNYSQATVLTKAKKAETDYYQGHPKLVEVWAQVISSTPSEKITATAIEKAIDPQYEDKQAVKLPKHILDRAKIQAAKSGMSLVEYLTELMDASDDEGRPVPIVETTVQVTEEMTDAIDKLEQTWLNHPPTKKDEIKVASATVESFDKFMDYLVGRFLPNRVPKP